MSRWVVGASIYVVGAGLIVFGENLVKRANTDGLTGEAGSEGGTSCNWATRTWLLGVVAFFIGNGSHFVAFMFAAQSMLESLSSSVLLWNLLIARLVNQERMTQQHGVATAIIIGGTSLALLFGPHGDTARSFDDLLDLFARPAFVGYLASLAVLLGSLQLLHVTAARRALAAGQIPEQSRLVALTFAAVSAGIGSNSVLLSKSVAEALNAMIGGATTSKGPLIPVALVVCWISLVSWWLWRLNAALKMYPALFIVPSLHAFWMSNSIVGGAIFFQEFRSSSTASIAMFALGVVVILCGVANMPAHDGGDASKYDAELNLADPEVVADKARLLPKD